MKTDKLLIIKTRNCKLSYWYREKHMWKGNFSLPLLDSIGYPEFNAVIFTEKISFKSGRISEYM